MTGTSAFRMVWTMERIERSRPPGVSSWRTRACARSLWARSTAVATSRTVTGVIAPSISITDTGAGAADAGAHGSTVRRSDGEAEGEARGKRSGVHGCSTPAMIARGERRLGGSASTRKQLEEEVRGEQAGDGAGPVVGR